MGGGWTGWIAPRSRACQFGFPDTARLKLDEMTPGNSDKAKKQDKQETDAPGEFPSGSALLRKIATHYDNLYELVVAAATRARQINAGSPTPIERNDNRPLNIALREIAAGRTKYEVAEEESEQ